MKDINAYIESGILELYVLGMATDAEAVQVEEMALQYEEVRAELDAISEALEMSARHNALDPHPTVKPLLLATINYMQRLQSGEAPEFPPMLNEHSSIETYKQWLNRADMVLSPTDEDIFARIIGYTPEVTTAIVWLRQGAPFEVHDDEYEKFLIVEGTCDIFIGEDEVHHLVPGDYLSIPLHKGHHVKVTSKVPCKVILQRVAA